MARIDVADKKIYIKLAYLGVSSSGKTTSIKKINAHKSNLIKENTLWHPQNKKPGIYIKYRSLDDIIMGYNLIWYIHTISRAVLYKDDWNHIITSVDGVFLL